MTLTQGRWMPLARVGNAKLGIHLWLWHVTLAAASGTVDGSFIVERGIVAYSQV
ncbi:MAG: hypothetical protein KF752_08615 [Pirellulaceae bacterium]|nr:hypothetical protein [Pirellulaceae bacterium]